MVAQVRCNTAASCDDAKTCPEGTVHEPKYVCDSRRYCAYKGMFISCMEYEAADPTAPIINLEEHLEAVVQEEIERGLYPTADFIKRVVKRLLEEIST